MSAKILAAAIIGLDGELVEVEADNSPCGNAGIFIVGLPDKAVDESRSRVRSAIKNSGFRFPRGHVTINLAPADLKKFGSHYDLAIALSCLKHNGEIKSFLWPENLFVGELALAGDLRPVSGILSVALMCQKKKIKNLFVPEINAKEAGLIAGLNIYPVKDLKQLADHFNQKEIIAPQTKEPPEKIFSPEDSALDMAFIKGQEQAKRALEIAAAGSHNILMSGPPGSGKTMLAKAVVSILPGMTLAESLEVTKIYSAAGLLPNDQPLITARPFRSPHHTASGVALVGGGAWPKPGEISLAHRGVLFLDEFLEFPKVVLENLRQPLEDGLIAICRAAGTLYFPANFMLVAAMNPCPCGFLNDNDHECACLPAQVVKYQKRASGPLLDRIDLHVEVPRVNFEKLESEEQGESSQKIKERVQAARDIQNERFKKEKIINNSEMGARLIKKYCSLDQASKNLLRQAVEKMGLSARSYYRLIKLARTIADLAGEEKIATEHVAESLQYRARIE